MKKFTNFQRDVQDSILYSFGGERCERADSFRLRCEGDTGIHALFLAPSPCGSWVFINDDAIDAVADIRTQSVGPPCRFGLAQGQSPTPLLASGSHQFSNVIQHSTVLGYRDLRINSFSSLWQRLLSPLASSRFLLTR